MPATRRRNVTTTRPAPRAAAPLESSRGQRRSRPAPAAAAPAESSAYITDAAALVRACERVALLTGDASVAYGALAVRAPAIGWPVDVTRVHWYTLAADVCNALHEAVRNAMVNPGAPTLQHLAVKAMCDVAELLPGLAAHCGPAAERRP